MIPASRMKIYLAAILSFLAIFSVSHADTVTCKKDSAGVTRCSDGTIYRTDSAGTIRGNDGTVCRTDSAGTTRCTKAGR